MADFLDWDAVALVEALRTGALSAETVMAATLARIGERNPAVNAIVDLRADEELLAEARAADAVPIEARGKLHGLPFAVKDLANVKGLRTTEGSPLYDDRIAEDDSRFISLLRAEGVIFIGKTNVPEFGLGSHSYNPVHGVTRNPFGHDRTAGGSSGGAAVGLATGMVTLADGSDMMGSLRNPAAWNNVYGFRPSWGVVPREPSGETHWQQLSTIGPMARSPRDMALMMSVLAQPDAQVPFNMPAQDWDLPEAVDVSHMRVGTVTWQDDMPFEAGIQEVCADGLAVLAGVMQSDVAEPAFDMEAMFQAWVDLRSFALAGELADLYLDPDKRQRLKPEAQWEIKRGLEMDAATLHRATKVRSAWFACAAKVFENFDALVFPAAQVWPFPADWDWPKEINGQKMDSYHRWMQAMVPASLIGLPVASVPVGFNNDGLPMGMQIIGAKGKDRKVLEVAQAYHQASVAERSRAPKLY
ncbi:MAG: amidase [Shimia sp.]|jgi:amidase|uniref:amidase n=1 Tax=Shimia sp. TaxID=1954381 RepID=UPI004059B61B